MSLLGELKRRNVLRVAAAYGVLSWLLIQVADTLQDTLDLPAWSGKLVVMLLLLGVVPTLVFSWVYELTPDGLKKESEVPEEQSVTAHTARKLDLAVIVLLVLAIGLFAMDRFGSPSGSSNSTVAAVEVPSTDTPSSQSSPSEPAAAAPRQSVAVLPFTNRSPDPDTAYFVDGIHDDLLTQLAKIGALKVISRTSVLEYRDTTKNLRQIGEELGVATVMEGAVQQAGDRVRVNAQLIDARTDEHLWAETYDREFSAAAIFDLQSDIARAIADALQATLSPEEEAQLERQLTDNLDALAAFQRARRLDDDLYAADQVQFELRRALDLDPDFVAAWAYLAISYLNEWWVESEDPGLRERAWEAIEHARSLDPSAPELTIAEGYFHYWGYRDYDRAREVLEPLLESRPNDSDLHEVVAFVNRRDGQFDKAIHHLEVAGELNPRSTSIPFAIGETHVIRRDLDAAREVLARLDELAPTATRTYELRGMLAMWEGRPAAAADYHRISSQDLDLLLPYLWTAHLAAGNLQGALEASQFSLIDQRAVKVPPMLQGIAHRVLGDPAVAEPLLDGAMAAIDAGLAADPGHYGYLKARCQTLGALGRTEAALEACEAALANIYEDAFDHSGQLHEIAWGMALAGLNDRAMELLESIMAAPVGPSRILLAQDPRLDGLHDHPRWAALVGEGGS